MSKAQFTAHYWTAHCEHCVGFDTAREAYEFRRAGARTHSMAVDKITSADGTVVASREELLGRGPFSAAARDPLRAPLARAAGPH
jgi:hypothetical protein